MSTRKPSISLKKRFEQRTYQVYAASPWVSREELIAKILKTIKRLKLTEEDARELVEMLGKFSVDEITKKLREHGTIFSPMDLWTLLEDLRKNGYVRVITTKSPAPITTKVEAKVMSVVEEAAPPPEEVISPVAPAIPTEVESVLSKIPIPEIPGEITRTATETVSTLTQAIPPELQEKVKLIKEARIVERYFEINEHLKAVAILPREGHVILLSMYRDVTIADAEVAAASTTIVSHAVRVADNTDLGDLKEIIIDSDLGYLVLAKLPGELVLVALFSSEVTIGLMIRDFMGLKNEITEIFATI